MLRVFRYWVYPIYFQPNTKLWKYSIFNNDIFGCEYRHSTDLLGNKLYDVSLPQIGAIVTDVKGFVQPLTPNDRIFEVLGSYAYRGGMSLLPKGMDGFKRLIIVGKMPTKKPLRVMEMRKQSRRCSGYCKR
jgi:hypothetical protein